MRSARAGIVALVLAAVFGASAGCDRGTGSYPKADGDPPRLVAIRIGPGATPCPDAAPGDLCLREVILQPTFVLQFDRPLAPSSVARTNYTIRSGSIADEITFQLPRVDPVESTVVFTLDAPLLPQTQYELHVRASDRPADRLASFDGTPFRGEAVVRFTTGGDDGRRETDNDPLATAIGADLGCRAVEILAAGCVGSQCHGDTRRDVDAGALAAPAMGLSLLSYEAIGATAINRAAVQVQLATDPGGTGGATTDFPRGLPLIEPGSSARSYLLYKMLRDPRRTAPKNAAGVVQLPPPVEALRVAPDGYDPFPRAAEELARVIPGAPMPHDVLPPEPDAGVYEPTSIENLRVLRAWIDRGALPCGAAPDAGVDAADTGSGTDAADTSSGTDAADDAVGDAVEDG